MRAEPLTPRQAAALAMLVAGKPLAAVAKQIGVSVRTLYTWRKDRRFDTELRRRSVEAMDVGALRASDLILRSTALLSDSMNGDDRYRWAFRVATSRRIWEMAQSMPNVEAFTPFEIPPEDVRRDDGVSAASSSTSPQASSAPAPRP